MADLPLEEKYRRVIVGDAMTLGTVVKAMYDKYGPEAIETMSQALEASGRTVGPFLARQAGARIGDGDITDLARMTALMDPVQGIESHWTELSPRRGTLKSTSCPAASQYRRYYPEICSSVLGSLVMGIAKVVNPSIVANPMGKCLTRGDDCCEVVFELR